MMTYSRRMRLHPFSLFIMLLLALVVCIIMMPSARAQSSPTHTIQPGETLSQIAEVYGISLEELMELNSIDDANAIVSGQILVLPIAANVTPAPVVVDESFGEPETTPIEHVVMPGESLSRIAEQYGLTLEELMEINGITDPDTIVIGTSLRLTPVITTDAALPDAPTPEPNHSGNPIASLNRTYTVESGDSVPYIALRFGVDEDALRWLNKLDDSVFIDVGTVLVLPATAQELIPPRQVEDTSEEMASSEEDNPTDSRPRYVVQPGDSLGRIAQEHGLSLAEIMETNQIANPDSIYEGQELIIPTKIGFVGEIIRDSGSGASEDADSEESEEAQSNIPHMIGLTRSGFFYYMVKPGDSLSELAREFNSTQLALMEYNDLPDTETVYAGLELRIPFGPPPLSLTLPPIPFSGSRFVVSLSRQQCWVLEANTVRYTWNCSTGYGEWITRTGNFAVQSKIEMAKSTAYELDMPFWLGIYDVGTFENGIHGLPILWKTGEKIWTTLIGEPATFGCAMLGDEDAATLYDMAFLGMPVHIVP